VRPIVLLAAAGTALALVCVTGFLTTRHASAAALAPAAGCGVERWPVKTLADPDAPHVHLTPKPTTIARLRRLTVIIGIEGTRGLGTERTTFRVHALLLEFKFEVDDDIHLVIADPHTGGTMIAELPDPICTHGALRGTRTRMQKARVALVTSCGFPPNGSYRAIHGTATIDGVGFFDRIHGQAGVAPNGIELHPVLRFSGRCT
jgi:hypothetical protein